MKKVLVFILVVSAIFALSVNAFGLNSPAVSKGEGVVTAMFATDDIGFLLGVEYGLSPKFAVSGRFALGDVDYTKLAVKYELNSNFALLGGVEGFGDETDPFFGINGSLAFDRDFLGIFEVDAVMAEEMYVTYEAGIKYNLAKQVDIRGGVFGWSTGDDSLTAFEVGVGYKF